MASDEHAASALGRITRYVSKVIWAGTGGLWRAVTLLAGFGLISAGVLTIGVGVALAAVFNVAWLFAMAVTLLLLISVIGSYRVWNDTDRQLTAARKSPPILVTGGAGGSGPGSGGGGGAAHGDGALAYGGHGGQTGGATTFEVIARASLGMGYTLDDFISQAGLTLREIDRAGAGGDGGSSGLPAGGQPGESGGPGLAVVKWLDDEMNQVGVTVVNEHGQFRIPKRDG